MTLNRLSHRAPLIGLIIFVVLSFAFFLILVMGGGISSLTPSSDSTIIETDNPLISKVVSPETPTSPTVLSSDPVFGNLSAPVRITVFSDFSCPHCATIATDLQKLVANRTDVAVIWKDFPISTTRPETRNAHLAARCAQDQGKFWEYSERLFLAQSSFSRATYLKIAQDLQLKPTQFAACLENTTTNLLVQEGLEEGYALGIDGTPFLFIGDQRISGLLSYDELVRAADIHLLINKK